MAALTGNRPKYRDVLPLPTKESVTKECQRELAREEANGTQFDPRQTAIILLLVRKAYDRGYEAGHFDAEL